MSLRSFPVGSLTLPVETWNPLREDPDETFKYIDLSSVDQDTKSIIDAKTILCGEAPSRARQLVSKADILVSTVRPNLNGVAQVPPEMDMATASTGFCVLRADPKKIEPRYLLQWVKSPAFISDMIKKATGASYPAVSDRIISESQIPLPDNIEQQRRIADILDRADALRAKRRAALARLDELTQAIFIEMFGDPVSNPKGWRRLALDEVAMKITDGEHLNPSFVQTGMPMVMAGNVLDKKVDLVSSKRVEWELGERFRKKCCPSEGDLLIVSRGATIGRLCVIRTKQPFCLMGSVILVKTIPDVLDSRFLSTFMKFPSVYSDLYKSSGSSAQQAIYIKDLRRLTVMVPPLDLQRDFAAKSSTVESMESTHIFSSVQLDALFASLQDRAFRGAL